ncbi:MAG: hypothetical protein U0570_13690 [Phycisphaerales bacterium]
MLPSRFGHFDNAHPSGSSFVVTDLDTPMPWVNVICNGRYGLVISQNGGGFSWFDDAQHNVLTRWEMDLVRDCYGKFLYVADLDAPLDAPDVWSLAPAPCRRPYDESTCTHALGSSTFHTLRSGIRANWTLTVDPKDHVEVWCVELTNTTRKPRSLRLASYFEWTCGVAPDVKREFHRLFFDVSFDESANRRAIVSTKNMWDIRPKTEREHWNVPWPYVAAHSVAGAHFDRPLAVADKQTFLGKYGSTATPKTMTVRDIAGLRQAGFGRFGDASASLGGDLTIAAGATIRLHFVLTIASDKKACLAQIDKYSDEKIAWDTPRRASEFWKNLLSATTVKTERADFDLLNNHWLPYQALSGRMWGRTGYYQQSGAFGFRDQLQDSQVWLPLDPAGTHRQIMLHAERQFKDGSVYHWWHALADFGNHTACSDDYLWLPFLVSNYIRETGDDSILQKTAPFVDEPAAKATILDHCQRSIERSFNRTSARGLPFIGSCDWNDGLSAMGIDEKGESVWLGMFLCEILNNFATVMDRAGQKDAAARYRSKRAEYLKAINVHAWDGAWYKYGTKDSGEWIGSSQSPEGKIHLNAQTWSILADIAPADRAAAAWESVKKNLLSPYGPLLLFPAYTIPDPTIGYVTRYSPGSRENGGVYMHAATWALAAACKRRDVESVARIWKSVSPPTRGQNADSYFAEPYVTPGNVDGPLSDKPGRAGWTWYTGSAAWLNRVSLEWILGIRPVFTESGQAGLLIDPVPPVEFGTVDAVRTWRGRRIRVRFDSRAFDPSSPARVSCNGREIPGGILTETDLNSVSHNVVPDVQVSWGTGKESALSSSGSKEAKPPGSTEKAIKL